MHNDKYPIRTVSAVTGVNSVTLRAWERRYGLIKPERTDNGHRLYSEQDVQRILNITELLDKGISISQVANSLDKGVAADQGSSPWETLRERMFHAVIAFNAVELEAVYNEALSLYPNDIVSRELLNPLLVQLGKRWLDHPGGIAEEHFFGSYLRNKLGAWFHHHQNQNVNGPTIIAACLPTEQHEVGLLLFCQLLITYGFQVVYLGPNLPVSELEFAVNRINTSAIVLSGSMPEAVEQIINDLAALMKKINIPIFIGGGISVEYYDQLDSHNIYALGTDIKQGAKVLKEFLKSN